MAGCFMNYRIFEIIEIDGKSRFEDKPVDRSHLKETKQFLDFFLRPCGA